MRTKEVTVKKGNRSWQAFDTLHVPNKDKDRFRYRFCLKDDDARMAMRLDQGWQIVNRETGIPGEVPPESAILGNSLTPNVRRELVLMALPEEAGQARDAWIEKQSTDRIKGIRKTIEENAARVGPGASVRPKIVIE